MFEKPWSSVWAKHYALFSLSVVVLSTFTFILSTQEEMVFLSKLLLVNKISLKDYDGEETPYTLKMQIIDSIDIATVAFFTFEYFARLAVCPNKVRNGEPE